MQKNIYGSVEPPLLKRVRDAGFKTFTSDLDYDLNIIALRSPSTDDRVQFYLYNRPRSVSFG